MLCTIISRKKTVSKWNFTPLCYALKVKWWKKTGYIPWITESLSRWVVVSPVIYMQNLNNTHFFSPWLSNFIPIKYKIGAHPISPQYSFHFITTITFLTLSNLERYKHNCYFSCDRYSSKLFRGGNMCQRIKKYPARNWYHNRILRADPFKGNGMMCIVFYIRLNSNLIFLAC